MFDTIAALTPGAFYRFEVSAAGKLTFINLSDKVEMVIGVQLMALESSPDAFFFALMRRIAQPYRQQLLADIERSFQQLEDLHSIFPIQTVHHG